MTNININSLLFSTIVISITLALSRLSGFIREFIIATKFGISDVTDTIIINLTFPEILVSIILAGGFNAALVPEMSKRNMKQKIQLMQSVSISTFIIFALLAFLFTEIAEILLRLLGSSLDYSLYPDHIISFKICLISLPIIALIGVNSSLLNSSGRFGIPNTGIIIFNFSLIIFIITQPISISTTIWFSIILIIAFTLRLLFQLYFSKISFQPIKKLTDALLCEKKLIYNFILGSIGFSIVIFMPLIFRSLYAQGASGNLATFNFSLKLFELPGALLVTPLSLSILPFLAHNFSKKNFETYRLILSTNLKIGIALSIGFAGLGIVFAEEVVTVLLGYGKISTDDIDSIALLFSIMLSALPFYTIWHISASGINAAGNQASLFRNSSISLILSIICLVMLQITVLNKIVLADYRVLISFVVFYFIASVLNFLALKVPIKINRNIIRVISFQILLPLSLSLICYILKKKFSLGENLYSIIAISLLVCVILLLGNIRELNVLLKYKKNQN